MWRVFFSAYGSDYIRKNFGSERGLKSTSCPVSSDGTLSALAHKKIVIYKIKIRRKLENFFNTRYAVGQAWAAKALPCPVLVRAAPDFHKLALPTWDTATQKTCLYRFRGPNKYYTIAIFEIKQNNA